jgi:SAM-dependent methyltransferase
MGLWTERVVPHIVDRALSTADVMSLRDAACAGLAGRVLELGFGSGLNADAYSPAVTGIDAVEPSDVGWSMSAKRRRSTPVPIARVGLDGQRLQAQDASYDAVLSTFTLCTIPDVGAALTEVRRVLRPGGSFHFLEHGRSPDLSVARWQHRLDPLERRVAGGCHLSRDIPALVSAAGLEVVGLETAYLPGPAVARPWNYVFNGRAVPSLV